MEFSKESAQAIDQVVAAVLETICIPTEKWEDLRATMLLSLPVWPGPDFSLENKSSLASYIDHTLLKPDAADSQITQLCKEAIQYGFATICVNSCHVQTCVSLLKDTDIAVCAVAGFPLGAAATEVKKQETEYIVDNGGTEVDMVINIGKLKTAKAEYVLHDIRAVVEAAWGNPVKVILETGLLEPDDIIAGSVLSVVAGAAFVKTSTGFGNGGATIDAVQLMRYVVGPHIGVKASGGIRDSETAIKMIRAGANRLGTSSGPAIIQ